MSNTKKYVYIIISKTNTILGKIIRSRLKVSYNHCSISTDISLNNIYSFGRKELHNMFRAGFVTESKNYGFFKLHSNTQITVLRIKATNEQLNHFEKIISRFKRNSEKLKYNILGLFYCYLGLPIKRENKYFCSQFVAEVLQELGIQGLKKPPTLTRPHDFIKLSGIEYIYTGTFENYYVS